MKRNWCPGPDSIPVEVIESYRFDDNGDIEVLVNGVWYIYTSPFYQPDLDFLLENNITEEKYKYEQIVFLDNQDSVEAFEVLNEEGELAALEYCKNWHYPGKHEVLNKPGYGTEDNVFRSDGYILSYNEGLGYMNLVYKI